MAKRPVKSSPVFKIEFEADGDNFTHWYVRDRIVIDCAPVQRRDWCGSHIARLPMPGQYIRFMTRLNGKYDDLPRKVISVEQLSSEQSAEIVAAWKQLRAEFINE